MEYFQHLQYTYIINIALVALPYLAFGGSGVAYNLWFNIDWNKFWAEGNWWLVSNSAYMVFTFLFGLADLLEIPMMMPFHLTRLSVLSFGYFYNLVFYFCIFEWYDMLYLITDKTSYDFFTVYVNMLLGFHIVLHFPTVILNNMIMFKEITMEFFQFLNPKAGTQEDEVSLGVKDLKTAEEDFVWAANPFTWIDGVGYLFGMEEPVEKRIWPNYG